MVGRHFGAVEDDPDLPPLSPDDLYFRDIDHLFDLIVDLGRNPPEHEMVIAITRERQRQDGDIVDGAGLDEGLACARRDQVEVGEHLLIEPDDALFLILTHLETGQWPSKSRATTWSRCTPPRGSPRGVVPWAS